MITYGVDTFRAILLEKIFSFFHKTLDMQFKELYTLINQLDYL